MIPSRFVALAALPLTPNGKVDRQALKKSGGVELAASDYTPPRTQTERTLTEIWQELLCVERVGVHDNFFHLGGHSLLVATATSRAGDRLGIEVPVAGALFDAPTIAGLAGQYRAFALATPASCRRSLDRPVSPCPYPSPSSDCGSSTGSRPA